MTHFNFNEWKNRLDLDDEDLIDWLGLKSTTGAPPIELAIVHL